MTYPTLHNGRVYLGTLAPETRFSIGGQRGRVIAQHSRDGEPYATVVRVHIRSGHYARMIEWSPHIAVEVES